MDERGAEAVARAIDGRTWNSGGGIWLVLKDRSDGKLVAITDESVCEYDSSADFEAGKDARRTILLT